MAIKKKREPVTCLIRMKYVPGKLADAVKTGIDVKTLNVRVSKTEYDSFTSGQPIQAVRGSTLLADRRNYYTFESGRGGFTAVPIHGVFDCRL